MDYLVIEYCDPHNHLDTVILKYKLRNTNIVEKWVKLVLTAQKKYSIDDPGRFYNFGTIEQKVQQALLRINNAIDAINAFEPIINRRLSDVYDQDTLNYLHHIFEVYHGLLDGQNHEFWARAPQSVHQALSNLNSSVHGCEDIINNEGPTHITTWYGMPKLFVLQDQDYVLFEDVAKIGTVYLNYTEIGKTLEDLALDNDQYIAEDAFRPDRHISADFLVKFFNDNPVQIEQRRAIIKEYYERNSEFFIERELPWGHPYLRSGGVPLADLENDPTDVVEQLTTRQWIKSINFI